MNESKVISVEQFTTVPNINQHYQQHFQQHYAATGGSVNGSSEAIDAAAAAATAAAVAQQSQMTTATTAFQAIEPAGAPQQLHPHPTTGAGGLLRQSGALAAGGCCVEYETTMPRRADSVNNNNSNNNNNNNAVNSRHHTPLLCSSYETATSSGVGVGHEQQTHEQRSKKTTTTTTTTTTQPSIILAAAQQEAQQLPLESTSSSSAIGVYHLPSTGGVGAGGNNAGNVVVAFPVAGASYQHQHQQQQHQQYQRQQHQTHQQQQQTVTLHHPVAVYASPMGAVHLSTPLMSSEMDAGVSSGSAGECGLNNNATGGRFCSAPGDFRWSNCDTYLHIFLTFYFGHFAALLFFDGILRSIGSLFALEHSQFSPLIYVAHIALSIALLAFTVWFMTVCWRWWRHKSLEPVNALPYVDYSAPRSNSGNSSSNSGSGSHATLVISTGYVFIAACVLIVGFLLFLIIGALDMNFKHRQEELLLSRMRHSASAAAAAAGTAARPSLYMADCAVFVFRLVFWIVGIVATLLLSRSVLVKHLCPKRTTKTTTTTATATKAASRN